jgi:hypothetical protein
MNASEIVAASRKCQGLKPKIDDPTTLAKVAALLKGGGRRAP